ncbi:torsin-1A-interacting protein 2-like [Labrus mixtus]|uniref:torsin-1A-interacting protein 2-like n=1 Tax=Labrus mixtus TaxID=508554 RepID=UPI0029BFB23C|nr:torsin-1A-interacting protein 2-like [Labrus mixtus]
MTEQPADNNNQQQTADDREEETQLINMDQGSESGGFNQEETLNLKQPEDSASSSACTNNETRNETSEVMEQADVSQNSNPAEEKMAPLTEGSLSLDHDNMLTMEESSVSPQTDDESHGDCNRETPKNEQPAIKAEDISKKPHAEEKTAHETAAPQGDKKEDQVDGPKVRENEESLDVNNTITEAEEDNRSSPEKGLAPEEEEEEEEEDEIKDPQENTTNQNIELRPRISVKEDIDEQRNVETIGPSSLETTEPVLGGNRRYLIVVGVVVLAIVLQYIFHPESPPQKNDEQQIDIFLRQMEKVMSQFPNQRAELWRRSRIHLLRHLQTAQPTEPVSLILTAGLRAEQTLHCLAQGLASAFSSALNASVLHIDGASKASQDSDQVKLDIDRHLQRAFEGDKPVAVIHRFEELPPGSTLIFYRYCDHENAAYKKTFLIFTVLLGEEEEIPAKSRLSAVEEMVDDHLQKKFLSDSLPVSYDRMDLDKYGGLWSRISHLILPVSAEDRVERDGC